MDNNKAPLPPLKTITASGKYQLKMIKPKDEKVWERIKYDKNGVAYARILFIDDFGNCLTKFFSAKSGTSLAMAVGKFSGQFVKAPDAKISAEDLLEFLRPAFGKKAEVDVEVKEKEPYNGKPSYDYNFKSIAAIGTSASSEPSKDEPPF